MTTPLAWLRSTVEAATSGPWHIYGYSQRGRVNVGQVRDEQSHIAAVLSDYSDEDARSITILHNLAPSLLAVVDAAKELAGCYEAVFDEDAEQVISECGKCDGCKLTAALAALDLRVEEERA